MRERIGQDGDAPLGFKVSKGMRSAVKMAAKKEKITVGEWLRRLVRAALGTS